MLLSFTDHTRGKSATVSIVFGSVDGMYVNIPAWDMPNKFLKRCRYESKGFENIDYFGQRLLAPRNLSALIDLYQSSTHCTPFRYLSIDNELVIAGPVVDVNALCDAYISRCINGKAASDPIRQLLAFAYRAARDNQLAITLACDSRAYSVDSSLPKPLYAAVAVNPSDADKWVQILNDSRHHTTFHLNSVTGKYLRLQYSQVSSISIVFVTSRKLNQYQDKAIYSGLPDAWDVPAASDPDAAALDSACNVCEFCIPVDNSTNTGSILHGESQKCLDSSSHSGTAMCNYNVRGRGGSIKLG